VRRPEILYGLGNFVENAADFAKSLVVVNAETKDGLIRVTIMDDGPGFPMDLIDRLGEPYITTRARGSAAAMEAQHGSSNSHEGMGLGFFIGKTLLERSGARVAIRNRADGLTGAMVIVEWPREAVEAPPMGGAQEQITDSELV